MGPSTTSESLSALWQGACDALFNTDQFGEQSDTFGASEAYEPGFGQDTSPSEGSGESGLRLSLGLL